MGRGTDDDVGGAVAGLREQVFEELLSTLGAADPLGSVLHRASAMCRGAGLVVNELGEIIRSVGAAPTHLISEWVLSAQLTEPAQTQIGRWTVYARVARIRQRTHAIVIAVHEESERGGVDIPLVLDTTTKILQAFEGFESFSISTRREESSRLMRDLEAGVSPGQEAAKWRTLENFGFVPYQAVRVVRARIRTNGSRSGSAMASSSAAQGIVVTDTGPTTSAIEHTALCSEDFAIEEHFADDIIRAGVSEPFTALSQVPELLRSADVALAAADPGKYVYVEQMRPVVWAAARMSSRFDRQIVRRYLDRLSSHSDSWSTLTTYIDSGANVAEAARRLQVHENTVRYRLSQIEKVLGSRIGDPRVMADVVIALECNRLETGE